MDLQNTIWEKKLKYSYILQYKNKLKFIHLSDSDIWEDFRLYTAKILGTLFLYFYYFQSDSIWVLSIVGLIILYFIWKIYWSIKVKWDNTIIEITPSYIQQYRINTPFFKDYLILKKDIALITAASSNQEGLYTINVVNHEGDILELRVLFDSKKIAQAQVEAMKQMLRLE